MQWVTRVKLFDGTPSICGHSILVSLKPRSRIPDFSWWRNIFGRISLSVAVVHLHAKFRPKLARMRAASGVSLLAGRALLHYSDMNSFAIQLTRGLLFHESLNNIIIISSVSDFLTLCLSTSQFHLSVQEAQHTTGYSLFCFILGNNIFVILCGGDRLFLT